MVLMWSNSTSLEIRQEVTLLCLCVDFYVRSAASALTGAGTGRRWGDEFPVERVPHVLGDEKLTIIAKELVDTVRKNVTIDWTLKESVQTKLRVMVKRILKKYGYPPDKQKKATETVLEQAKLICKDLAESPMI